MLRKRTDPDVRLLSKVSKLYYEQGLTQHEIAERLRLSRPKVSRLLQQARADGIVQITVLSPPGIYASVEEELESRFGLQEAVVVDAGASDAPGAVSREIGAAAADYLQRTVGDGDVIGIAWGSTLNAMVSAVSSMDARDAHVVQIIGGLGSPESEVHATDLCRRLAQALGCRLTLLPAPGIVDSSAVKRALESDRHVRAALELQQNLTVAFVGIGAPTPSSVVMRDGFIMSEDELGSLRALGAVGDIALRFFDAEGRAVRSELDERVIGITLDDLKRVQRVVGVAGGEQKDAVIRAALAGKLVDVLVTDVSTARRLLEPESIPIGTHD
jgi:DNA-binding transcriptional regulator LsrR (DeoR family)